MAEIINFNNINLNLDIEDIVTDYKNRINSKMIEFDELGIIDDLLIEHKQIFDKKFDKLSDNKKMFIMNKMKVNNESTIDDIDKVFIYTMILRKELNKIDDKIIDMIISSFIELELDKSLYNVCISFFTNKLFINRLNKVTNHQTKKYIILDIIDEIKQGNTNIEEISLEVFKYYELMEINRKKYVDNGKIFNSVFTLDIVYEKLKEQMDGINCLKPIFSQYDYEILSKIKNFSKYDDNFKFKFYEMLRNADIDDIPLINKINYYLSIIDLYSRNEEMIDENLLDQNIKKER